MKAKKGNPGVVQGIMMSLIYLGIAGLVVAILIAVVGNLSNQFTAVTGANNLTNLALGNTSAALATFPNSWLSLMVLGVCAGALITIIVVGILGIFGKGKQ